MSALIVNSGNSAVDPGHQLEELIEKVKPHLSHLTSTVPIPQRIIGLYDEELSGACEPINKVYVMTTHGLAHITRTLFVFKQPPRLMSHVALSMIDAGNMREITAKLMALLDQQYRNFPETRV